MDMVSSDLTLTVTEFKARCLEIFKRLDEGRLKKVTITRRGKPVGILTDAHGGIPSNWLDDFQREMAGSIWIDPDLDLTQPIFDGEMDAEKGILYNGE